VKPAPLYVKKKNLAKKSQQRKAIIGNCMLRRPQHSAIEEEEGDKNYS
jgi:hypothetical protein